MTAPSVWPVEGYGPHDPWPGALCHCGDDAEYLDIARQLWCLSCKYGHNYECACSHRLPKEEQ